MIIKKLSASFGSLKNDTMELKSGLNIIEAPNESGKSTWCAFIRTMLYGINTADRDKIGYLSDKTRYMPWSGAAMEGSMDITARNHDISLSRSSLRAAPMKNFSAVYTDTAEAVEGLTGDNAGEVLTGVPEKVFERSVFIRQSGLSISQTAELEKRMSSIVSSGDELTSYSEADSKLREWLRKRRYKQSGLLPKLESDIQAVDRKLTRLEEISSGAADLRLETQRLASVKAEMENELKAHDIIDKAMEYKRVLDSMKKAEDAGKDVEKAEFNLRHDGHLATKEDIQAAREALSKVHQLKLKLGEQKSEGERLGSAAENQKKGLQDSVFSGCSTEEAEKRAEDHTAEYEALNKTSKKKHAVSLVFFLLSLVLAAVGTAIVWYMNLEFFFYAIPAALVVLAAIFLIVFICKKAKGAKARKKCNAILALYRVSDISGITELLKDYRSEYEAMENTENELDTLNIQRKTNEAELLTVETELYDKIRVFTDKFTGIDDAGEAIDRTDKLVDELNQANMRKSAADNIYSTLSEAAGDFSDFTLPKDLERPAHSRAQAQASLNSAVRDLEKAAEDYAMAMGEARAIGDPAVLGAEISGLDDRRMELENQYEAISIAIEALKAANTEIQTRFSPMLSQRAGIIMSELTDGRYKKLLFDSDLSAQAEVFGDSIAHDVIALSQGTADQLYLALRLAISQLMLPSEDPCPLILDDALVNFDSRRMELAMDWLIKEAENRQIIMFTCHSREGDYALKNGNVNIVKL